jgi:hypothetical protein
LLPRERGTARWCARLDGRVRGKKKTNQTIECIMGKGDKRQKNDKKDKKPKQDAKKPDSKSGLKKG